MAASEADPMFDLKMKKKKKKKVRDDTEEEGNAPAAAGTGNNEKEDSIVDVKEKKVKAVAFADQEDKENPVSIEQLSISDANATGAVDDAGDDAIGTDFSNLKKKEEKETYNSRKRNN